MRTETVKIFKYEELSDKAKEKAREWYAGLVFNDSSDWEFVYQEVDNIAAMIGIDIDRRDYKTVGGSTRQEPCIWFSGFSSQGDGACFEGTYRYKKGSVKAVKEYAPKDEELHRIVRGLYDLQKRNFYQLHAVCKHLGHYSHSGCMDVEVDRNGDFIQEVDGEVRQLLRDFADWIYGQLENEYDYRTSDEAVAEAIIANEYEFYESGERV